MEESENVRLRQDGGLHSLHIVHVGSEDEGLYAVSAANTHGQAHCSAQLILLTCRRRLRLNQGASATCGDAALSPHVQFSAFIELLSFIEVLLNVNHRTEAPRWAS